MRSVARPRFSHTLSCLPDNHLKAIQRKENFNFFPPAAPSTTHFACSIPNHTHFFHLKSTLDGEFEPRKFPINSTRYLKFFSSSRFEVARHKNVRENSHVNINLINLIPNADSPLARGLIVRSLSDNHLTSVQKIIKSTPKLMKNVWMWMHGWNIAISSPSVYELRHADYNTIHSMLGERRATGFSHKTLEMFSAKEREAYERELSFPLIFRLQLSMLCMC